MSLSGKALRFARGLKYYKFYIEINVKWGKSKDLPCFFSFAQKNKQVDYDLMEFKISCCIRVAFI